MVLVQDEQRLAGFPDAVSRSTTAAWRPARAEARRAAFRGWTYAPLIARNLLSDLTHSQRTEYRLRIYDGTQSPTPIP